MKRIIFILSLTMLFITGCKTQQDPAKKAAQQQEDAIWGEKALQALNDRNFVLEADKVYFRNGKFVYVNAITNFISVHENKATIQLAFASQYAGPNGLGGITVEGNISNVKMTKDKKGNITFSMMVQGVGISANVLINMFEGSNKCTATVSPNFNSNRIDFSGNLFKEEDSNIFKGRSI